MKFFIVFGCGIFGLSFLTVYFNFNSPLGALAWSFTCGVLLAAVSYFAMESDLKKK